MISRFVPYTRTEGVRRDPYIVLHYLFLKVGIALFRNVTIAYLLYTDALDYKPKERHPTSIPGARDYLHGNTYLSVCSCVGVPDRNEEYLLVACVGKWRFAYTLFS